MANREVVAEVDPEAFSAGEVTDGVGNSYQVGQNDDGRFFIRQVGADEPEMLVAGVIEETPLRQYLMQGERGRLRAHSLAWDPDRKEWFSVFGDEERLAGEWGHWTGQGMNWNANCASLSHDRVRQELRSRQRQLFELLDPSRDFLYRMSQRYGYACR